MSDQVRAHPILSLEAEHYNQRRLDLHRVAAAIRLLIPSVDPARVLGQLAGACVPFIADECSVAITEYGGHLLRIRQPMSADPTAPQNRPLEDDPNCPSRESDHPGAGEDVVTVRFSSSEGDCHEYSGVLACRWTDGYHPTDADAGVIALLVAHATAIIERERLARQVADLQANTGTGQGLHLPGNQRIAAAVGILMALHHLSATQAADLLTRASEHTHLSIRGVADTVLRTGAMPDHIHRGADARRIVV